MKEIYEMTRGMHEDMTELERANQFWANARERVMIIAEANCFPLELKEHDDPFLYDLYDCGEHVPSGDEIVAAIKEHLDID